MSAVPAIPGPTQEQIKRLEMLNLQLPQIDLQTKHYFANGLYAREIFIPAGTGLTGAAHRTEHLSIVNGDIEVSTDEGMRRITGHAVLVCAPGKKRVGYAHADTYWTTLHATDERDLDKLERLLTDEAEHLQTRRLVAAETIIALESPCHSE